MDTLASPALLVDQYRGLPRLGAVVTSSTDRGRDGFLPAVERLGLMAMLDHAEGVYLDAVGRRLGVARPAVADAALDPRWGFDAAGVGWDQRPFRGAAENDAIFPLGDGSFRAILRGRVIAWVSAGTFGDLRDSIFAIDPNAIVVDNRDMTVRITSGVVALLELADSLGAIARSPGLEFDYHAS